MAQKKSCLANVDAAADDDDCEIQRKTAFQM
jgi:hypothetical protein